LGYRIKGYYGTMSLALAEILLKQDGLSSLDKAREQHNHHGLSISAPQGQIAPALASAADQLRAIPMEIKGERKGTFEIWHGSCRELPVGGLLHTIAAEGGSTNRFAVLMGVPDTRLPAVPSSGINLLDCLRSIPHLFEHLASQGILPLTLRAKLEMLAYPPPTGEHRLTLTLHPSPLNADFIENFKIEPGWVERIAITEVQTGYVINITMYDAISRLYRAPESRFR
jgi:hypothetical protein